MRAPNPFRIWWGFVFGVIAAFAAIAGFVQLFPLARHFLLDLAIAGVATSVAVVLWCLKGAHVFGGLRSRRWSRIQRGTLAALLLVGVLMVPWLALSCKDYYRMRIFGAKFDWHYSRAKAALREDDFRKAAKEWDAQGRYTYIDTLCVPRVKRQHADVVARVKDCDHYIKQFTTLARGAKAIPFNDLFMAQRASALMPDDPAVGEIVNLAGKRLETAIQPYRAGVAALRRSELRRAERLLWRSDSLCPGILDVRVLRKWCDQEGRLSLSTSEREVVEGYIQASAAQLEDYFNTNELLTGLATSQVAPGLEGVETDLYEEVEEEGLEEP
jgi:hypothetical protein